MERDNSKNNTRLLVYGAILVAMSFVGSLIKIPGTTIALDSMPGFLASLYLGPLVGGLVATLGHFLTSLISGFPLTLPIHLIVMLEMGISAYFFGLITKKLNPLAGIVTAIILNGVLAPLVLVPVTSLLEMAPSGMAFFKVMVGPLTVVGGVNIIFAYIINKFLPKNNI